jgi:peptide deformylase
MTEPERLIPNLEQLAIIHYPDPRLRKAAAPITRFDEDLARLAERMFDLMRQDEGVGLAAPQVGLSLRLFVANATGKPEDALVCVNPELHDLSGSAEAEEGCLSIPGVRVKVRRAARCRLRASDAAGRWFERDVDGLLARVCQHELDHLNGVLILDRMGPGDRLATRKALRALEEDFHAA